MSASQGAPLDEIQWRSPAIAQSMGGIHTDSGKSRSISEEREPHINSSLVLHYFANSPFFDATSNNATLATQANFNPSMFHLMQTREAFENRLRTMQGLEFMVAYEPKQPAEPAPAAPAGDFSGIWVIRKQNRRKRQGYEDEVTVLSTYFLVGENIYMAPSVANVIGSRLVKFIKPCTFYISWAKYPISFPPSRLLLNFSPPLLLFHSSRHRLEIFI